MTYEQALKEAELNAKNFPTTKDEDGRDVIEVNGKKYPKDWFIRQCARMKADGEI